jgi:hypothetical protein
MWFVLFDEVKTMELDKNNKRMQGKSGFRPAKGRRKNNG